VGLCVVDADGRVVACGPGSVGGRDPAADAVRKLAIDEALRWGDPEVQAAPGDMLVWAVPLMNNSRITGGLLAAITEQRLFPGDNGEPAIDTRAACVHLRELAEEFNLTNAALLEARRHESRRQRQRAEAIHAYKLAQQYDLRAMYQLDEPLLIAAIRRGDGRQARALLNRLLVGLMQRAGDRVDLIKSFFMELVVTLCRAAVEAGGQPEELLGANFASISELSRINSEEELAPWLHEMLERIIAAIQARRKQAHPAMLSMALQYMDQHAGEKISRDDVARVVAMSPAHFSRFFKKHLARGFAEVLSEMRVERAADLITQTDKDLKQISLEAGFADQSYFTKVFHKLRGTTPAEYRQQQRQQ
jgi:AraC-like DNA-binding protein